jgi:hypothetical protein
LLTSILFRLYTAHSIYRDCVPKYSLLLFHRSFTSPKYLSSFEYNFEFAEELNFDVGSGPTVCAPSPRGIVTQLLFTCCMIRPFDLPAPPPPTNRLPLRWIDQTPSGATVQDRLQSRPASKRFLKRFVLRSRAFEEKIKDYKSRATVPLS